MLTKDSPLLGKPKIIYRAISVILAAIILIADELLPLGVSVGEAYCALVLVGLLGKDKPLIIGSAIAGTILTLIGIWLSPPEAQLWIVWVNRILSIFLIWLTAGFSLLQIQSIVVREETEEIKTAYQLLKQEMNYVKLNRIIAVLANSKQRVEDDLADAMQTICQYTGWPVGHLYLRDDEKEVLNPTKIWHLKDPEKFAPFKKITEATPLALGEGLPGRVVNSGSAEWIIDVLKDKNFPRARQAIEIGVHAGFAFPILIGPKVVGVMEFFSEETLEPDSRLLEVMESIGYLLGRIFERYQANLDKEEYDEHLRSLYNRLESARQTEDKRIAGGSQSDPM